MIVRDVLSDEHLKLANEAIDSMELTPSPRVKYFGESVALRGQNSSTRLGNSENLMELSHPWCEPFREMLAHPKTTPHLNTILSEGWRLDHGPGLIAMDKGCSGGMLHGNFDNAPYFYREGRIFTGLCVIEYLLADEGPGDGGISVIAGSHKANLACPAKMLRWEQYQEYVTEINARAGDAVIFSEACTHGTLPWNADHQRRAILYNVQHRPHVLGRGRTPREPSLLLGRGSPLRSRRPCSCPPTTPAGPSRATDMPGWPRWGIRSERRSAPTGIYAVN